MTPETAHHAWDNAIEPVVTVDPGDVVRCDIIEGSDGQIWRGAPPEVLMDLDLNAAYPLAGPIEVSGSKPGDVLAIKVLDLTPSEWGWTGFAPGFGLLSEDFPEPYIRYFDLTDKQRTSLCEGVTIPLQPFLGTMGVALDDSGTYPVAPPNKGGGNVDTRHLIVGAELFLPIFVPGALLSVGDPHAAQGDGEVCGTAIECGMEATLQIDVLRGGVPVRDWTYRFTTPPGSPQPASDVGGYMCISALGSNLMDNARRSVRELIDWIVSVHGLTREDAYVLCSLAADLKISQIVDDPIYSVTACLSLDVFRST